MSKTVKIHVTEENIPTQNTSADYANTIGHAAITCYATGVNDFDLLWLPDADLGKALLNTSKDSLVAVTEAAPSWNSYNVYTVAIKKIMHLFGVNEVVELGKPHKIHGKEIPNFERRSPGEITFLDEEIKNLYTGSAAILFQLDIWGEMDV